LHIDSLSPRDGVDVQDHSLPAWVDIVMKAGHTHVGVVGHYIRAPIELSAKQLSARAKVKCIVKEAGSPRSYSCRTDPSDFGFSIDNDGRDRIGKAFQQDKVVAQARQQRLNDGWIGVRAAIIGRLRDFDAKYSFIVSIAETQVDFNFVFAAGVETENRDGEVARLWIEITPRFQISSRIAGLDRPRS